MIFDKLVALKISLDFYRKSRNPIKKLIYYFLLKSILERVKTIRKSIVSFVTLSEFQEFVLVADSNKISDIVSNAYDYSNTLAQEIIIKQPGLGSITILLRHKNNSIEVDYPLSPRSRVNKIYKHNIEEVKNIVPDKNTIAINNSIRNYIYDFTVSYMKGEFDYEETKELDITRRTNKGRWS